MENAEIILRDSFCQLKSRMNIIPIRTRPSSLVGTSHFLNVFSVRTQQMSVTAKYKGDLLPQRHRPQKTKCLLMVNFVLADDAERNFLKWEHLTACVKEELCSEWHFIINVTFWTSWIITAFLFLLNIKKYFSTKGCMQHNLHPQEVPLLLCLKC